ncbi:MAG: hypothetical protein R3E42_10800 [Burkholderiaceae bacterium]
MPSASTPPPPPLRTTRSNLRYDQLVLAGTNHATPAASGAVLARRHLAAYQAAAHPGGRAQKWSSWAPAWSAANWPATLPWAATTITLLDLTAAAWAAGRPTP